MCSHACENRNLYNLLQTGKSCKFDQVDRAFLSTGFTLIYIIGTPLFSRTTTISPSRRQRQLSGLLKRLVIFLIKSQKPHSALCFLFDRQIRILLTVPNQKEAHQKT